MTTVLIDSSWWIAEARARRDPISRLTVAAHNRDLAICGVVRCEVGRGVKQKPALRRLQRFWDVMLHVPTDNALWASAEELLWRLDRAGRQIPLADAVIACCALRINAAVLTLDGHFREVPGLHTIQDARLL